LVSRFFFIKRKYVDGSESGNELMTAGMTMGRFVYIDGYRFPSWSRYFRVDDYRHDHLQ